MDKQIEHKINEHGVNQEEITSFALIDNIAFHFGQNAEDVVLLRLFNQKSNGFYVDIGAYSPTRYSNTFLLHHLYGWKGINIDASKEAIDRFEKERPNDINIHAAIGEKASNKTYYIFEGSARNTFSEANVERQRSKNDVNVIGEETLQVYPLSEILSNNLPRGTNIDVLDLDVEGLEMQILESNDWQKFRPSVILVEDYEVGVGNLKKSPVYKYMTKMGYEFIAHNFDTSFYIDKKINIGNNLTKINREEFINNLHKTNELFSDTDFKDKYNVLVEKLIVEKEQATNKLRQLNQQHRSIITSRSWKITKPLRALGSIIRKIFRQ